VPLGPDNDPEFRLLGMTIVPKGTRCPNCHSRRKVVPILYGMPDFAVVKLVRRGRLHLAGCDAPERNAPIYHCRRCDYEWF
jgi:hypothetical protein